MVYTVHLKYNARIVLLLAETGLQLFSNCPLILNSKLQMMVN